MARRGISTAAALLLLNRTGGAAASTLLDGLVAFWTLNEASGVNRADSVGSSTAVLNGTVASVAAKFGNGANFNANAANFLSVAHNAAIAPAGTSFTIACWVKWNVQGIQGVLRKGGGTGGHEYMIDLANTTLRFLAYGSTTANTTVTIPHETSNYHAIRAWINFATNTIYIQFDNDTPGSAAGPTGGIKISDGPLEFGVFDGSTRPGNQIMDSVALWNRVLTDDEWTEWLALTDELL